MRTDEIIRKLQRNIRNQMSQRDLISLCTFMNLSSAGRKTQIQERLVLYIQNQSYETLLVMSNKIDEDYLRIPTVAVRPSQTTILNRSIPERLTDVSLRSAPINLEEEVPPNLRSDLSVPVTVSHSYQSSRLPSHPMQGGIERCVEMPNMMLSTQISTSPFYSCCVCLHPLILLKSQYSVNSTVCTKTTSRQTLTFHITDNVKNILSRNQYLSGGGGNKVEHKWQILLRFIAIDPNKIPTNTQEKIIETIPPYLTVAVNEVNQNLWDILPSNSKQKEGKRHAKAVNITDKLHLPIRSSSSPGTYPQNVTITWWQTPTVFLYYYFGVYLERKLTVREMMTLYNPNSPFNNRSIEETLKFIQSKLGSVSKSSKKDDDDDLVISNVLPINLCCPVGKSRINIPLRTVSCQHLQCFDAQLFLSMNERRPVWKCPVCDSRATPDDLFRDKYFQKILDSFKDDEEVTDVNVHPDNSFVAMKRKDREQMDKPNVSENSNQNLLQNADQSEQDLIVLDSDEETEPLPPKPAVQPKVSLPPKDLVTPKSNAPQPPPYSTPLASLFNKEPPIDKDQRVNITNTTPVPVPISTVSASNEISGRDNPISRSQLNQSSNNNIFSSVTRHNLTSNLICPPANVPISMSPMSNYLMPTAISNLTPPASYESPKTTQSTIPASLFRSSNLANSFMTCAITPPSIFNSPTTTNQNSATTNTFVQTTVPSAFGNPISVIGTKAVFDPQVLNAKLPIIPSPVSSDTPSSKRSHTSSSEFNSSHKDRFGTRKSIDIEISKDSGNVLSTTTTSTTTPIATPPNPLLTSSNSSSTNSSQSIVRTPSVLTTTPITTTTASSASAAASSQKYDNINGSLRLKETLCNDVVDDVVRTLPVSNMPDLSTKNRISDNQSPEPIVCPNVIIQLPEKKQSKPDSNKSPSPPPASPNLNKKNENQKKSKFVQSKIPPPAPLVAIPSVTIDLTEEDDEVQQIPINLKPSSLFSSKSLSWVPVNAPIPGNMSSNGIQNSKMQLNNYNHFLSNKEKESRKLSAIGIGHFKPHQMRFNNNNVPYKVNNKTNGPIDLTGDDDDDEDEDEDKYEDHIPSKRQKINHTDDAEDGQVVDSDEDSSSANYSPPNITTNNSSSLNRNVQKNACHVVSKKKL